MFALKYYNKTQSTNFPINVYLLKETNFDTDCIHQFLFTLFSICWYKKWELAKKNTLKKPYFKYHIDLSTERKDFVVRLQVRTDNKFSHLIDIHDFKKKIRVI